MQPLEVLDRGGLTLHPVGEMSTDGLQLLLYSVVELQGFNGNNNPHMTGFLWTLQRKEALPISELYCCHLRNFMVHGFYGFTQSCDFLWLSGRPSKLTEQLHGAA